MDVWKAVKEGKTELVKAAIAQGFNAAGTDSEGCTVIHLCAAYDTENHIQLLAYLVATYPGEWSEVK